ncbi:MAG: hypothetical protein GYB31_17270 [Bacteroidetes bacterium]|nr:hypothetical protein [Bacteroidota bacterium]
MPKKLSSQEYDLLLTQYKSDLRILETQVSNLKSIIKETEKGLKDAKKAEKSDKPKGRRGRPPKAKTADAADKPKRGRGRPPKAKTADAADKPKRGRGRPPKPKTADAADKPKRGRGRPPKAKTAKAKDSGVGYRLNDIDDLILKSISRRKRALVSSELFDLAKKKMKKDGKEVSDVSLRGKLNRSIHKLANKHGRLIKTDFPGKGYAYALTEWAKEDGQIDEKYLK